MATIKDVAKRANVSSATVSFVLNNRTGKISISDATKERVKAAVKELGYQPNTYAQTLRTKQSFIISILAFDIVDPYCANVIRGSEETFKSKNYFSMISDLQNDNQSLNDYLIKLKNQRIAGLLILASSLQIDDQTVTQLTNMHIPFVIIGREIGNPFVSTVVTDNINGSFLYPI